MAMTRRCCCDFLLGFCALQFPLERAVRSTSTSFCGNCSPGSLSGRSVDRRDSGHGPGTVVGAIKSFPAASPYFLLLSAIPFAFSLLLSSDGPTAFSSRARILIGSSLMKTSTRPAACSTKLAIPLIALPSPAGLLPTSV